MSDAWVPAVAVMAVIALVLLAIFGGGADAPAPDPTRQAQEPVPPPALPPTTSPPEPGVSTPALDVDADLDLALAQLIDEDPHVRIEGRSRVDELAPDIAQRFRESTPGVRLGATEGGLTELLAEHPHVGFPMLLEWSLRASAVSREHVSLQIANAGPTVPEGEVWLMIRTFFDSDPGVRRAARGALRRVAPATAKSIFDSLPPTLPGEQPVSAPFPLFELLGAQADDDRERYRAAIERAVRAELIRGDGSDTPVLGLLALESSGRGLAERAHRRLLEAKAHWRVLRMAAAPRATEGPDHVRADPDSDEAVIDRAIDWILAVLDLDSVGGIRAGLGGPRPALACLAVAHAPERFEALGPALVALAGTDDPPDELWIVAGVLASRGRAGEWRDALAASLERRLDRAGQPLDVRIATVHHLARLGPQGELWDMVGGWAESDDYEEVVRVLRLALDAHPQDRTLIRPWFMATLDRWQTEPPGDRLGRVRKKQLAVLREAFRQDRSEAVRATEQQRAIRTALLDAIDAWAAG